MKRIAIIGSGFSGLSTAYDLTKNGHHVDVYERANEIGGLVAGTSINGYPVEKIYHFIYKSDTAIRELVDELGLHDDLIYHDSSISTYFEGKLYPFMTPLDLLKFSPLSLIDRVRAGLVVMMLQFQNRWDQFKTVTAYDWMMKWAGKNVTRVIWEPLLRGKFDIYYDKVAMTFLWSRIKVRALSKEKGDTVEKLGYFNGGWAKLVSALETQIISSGGSIITSASVSSVKKNQDGIFTLINNEDEIKYDSVLFTTPSKVLLDIVGRDSLPAEYVTKLDGVDYIGAVVMLFASDEEITPYYWHNITDPSIKFLVLLNLTALTGPERFGGKYVYYIGDYLRHDHEYFSATDEKIQTDWFNSLSTMFPDADMSKIEEPQVFRFKNAQHIVDVKYSEKLVPFATPIDGIYMANFSQIYPDDRGTNFSVRDGRAVASEIERYLGKR